MLLVPRRLDGIGMISTKDIMEVQSLRNRTRIGTNTKYRWTRTASHLHRAEEDTLTGYTGLAIQNKTLFEVHAHERIVFDTKLELDFPKVKGKSLTALVVGTGNLTTTVDGETISDHVVPFSVMVPLTNVGPTESRHLHAMTNSSSLR
jgi:hypothetical protein